MNYQADTNFTSLAYANGLLIQIGLALALSAVGSALHWLYVGAIAQALTMLLMVAVTVITPPARPDQYEPFLWRPALLQSHGYGRAAAGVAKCQALVRSLCGDVGRHLLVVLVSGWILKVSYFVNGVRYDLSPHRAIISDR